jgi:hypothetical protein
MRSEANLNTEFLSQSSSSLRVVRAVMALEYAHLVPDLRQARPAPRVQGSSSSSLGFLRLTRPLSFDHAPPMPERNSPSSSSSKRGAPLGRLGRGIEMGPFDGGSVGTLRVLEGPPGRVLPG